MEEAESRSGSESSAASSLPWAFGSGGELGGGVRGGGAAPPRGLGIPCLLSGWSVASRSLGREGKIFTKYIKKEKERIKSGAGGGGVGGETT